MSSGRNRSGLLYDCICPRCGKSHKSQIVSDDSPSAEWAGRGKPPIFCKLCKIQTGWYYQDGYPLIDFDAAGKGA